MKKIYLNFAFCFTFVTNSFCAENHLFVNGKFHSSIDEVPTRPEELVLPLIEKDNLSPEDLVQNYLYRLDQAFRSGYSLFNFISASVKYAKGSLSHRNLPIKGKEGLRYLFIEPSDKKRMQNLEKRLKCWLSLISHHYEQHSNTYQKKQIQRLEKFLDNKQEVTESLKISHPQLFPPDQSDKDDYGINWPCSIL